ncbi:MAG: hypothetical protein A2W99_11175 [Bacteroidetes bacterium GWF2_33_16]|nr:MAG: hypothetical protein A2X00_04565 [Bacteroidetes bacterium GWE2_32_14]OFY04097.1 MAG: hypothetical protein A2W99_11175 [Bacteroidetes bacterium GWF2_33_16]
MINPRYIKILIILTIVTVFELSIKTTQAQSEDKYVVVLSMDAFRWDYTTITSTPVLDSIATIGVKAQSFKPAFPTLTFPNHYSLATGLYPDNHGIVSNNFYDDSLKAVYRIGDRVSVEDGRFYGGEPIWVTAEKQGMISASFYWVGSEAPIQGIQPTYWKKYDGNVSFENRIDTVIAWLQKPEDKRPHLIMFYFDEPDAIAHKFGPGAPQVNTMVTYLDSLVGVFIKKINALPIGNKINFIIVSDHGMAETSSERVIDLSKYIKKEWVSRSHGGNPSVIIKTAANCEDSILTALSTVKNLKSWKTSEVPERLHYGKNPRTMDILVLADINWVIGWNSKNKSFKGGAHGYDNNEPDMLGIFYAIGPDFKNGYLHKQIEGVDLYPLLTKLLNLKPAITDGKLLNTLDMLK